MFLSSARRGRRKARSSLPTASSCTRAETQMPPGSASASRRAAILTPSPKISPSSTMTSPRLIPMRNSMRSSGGPRRVARSACRAWISTAQRTASTDAGELDQQAVAGGLDDATVMGGDLRIDQSARNALSRAERAFLVGAHQPRIARHIGGEDGGETALDPIRRSSLHGRSPGRTILDREAPVRTIGKACPLAARSAQGHEPALLQMGANGGCGSIGVVRVFQTGVK